MPPSRLPLTQIYFYLTEGCNLACRHCWLAPRFDPEGSRYPTLPLELFAAAVREAKPLGLTRVKLTGGEPLLHPRFVDILQIARAEGLSVNIESNGTLCTPAIASEIAALPRRQISISIDGVDAATHEWVRGVPGSFARAQQAVRNLSAAGVGVEVIMSVMRCNADQTDDFVRMAEKLGAKSVKFNIIQPTARGEQRHQMGETLDIGELVRLGRRIEVELSRTTSLRIFFSYPLAFRALSRIAAGGCSTCGILNILGVLADGHYAMCGIGANVPDLVFGRIGEDRLERLWREHPKLQELREGLPSQLRGVCSRCLMKATCLGSCLAQNYYRTGSFWEPFWFCEMAEKAGLFPESRLIIPKTVARI